MGSHISRFRVDTRNDTSARIHISVARCIFCFSHPLYWLVRGASILCPCPLPVPLFTDPPCYRSPLTPVPSVKSFGCAVVSSLLSTCLLGEKSIHTHSHRLPLTNPLQLEAETIHVVWSRLLFSVSFSFFLLILCVRHLSRRVYLPFWWLALTCVRHPRSPCVYALICVTFRFCFSFSTPQACDGVCAASVVSPSFLLVVVMRGGRGRKAHTNTQARAPFHCHCTRCGYPSFVLLLCSRRFD